MQIAVPNNEATTFRYNEHRRHLLLCGTQLIQGRAESNSNYLKAVVIRTGKTRVHPSFSDKLFKKS